LIELRHVPARGRNAFADLSSREDEVLSRIFPTRLRLKQVHTVAPW